jgi:hypothetical protein
MRRKSAIVVLFVSNVQAFLDHDKVREHTTLMNLFSFFFSIQVFLPLNVTCGA